MKLVTVVLVVAALVCVLAAQAVAGDRPQRNLVEKALVGTGYAKDLPETWTIKNAKCSRSAWDDALFKCFLRLQSPYDSHVRIVRSEWARVVSVDPFTVCFVKLDQGR